MLENTNQAKSKAFHAPQALASLEEFVRMGREEFDRIYAQGDPGKIPEGDSIGKAIFLPGSKFTDPLSKIARFFWQGKVFHTSTKALYNKVMGFKAIKADVYVDKSWSDGKPAIIIDYSKTSLLVGKVRDEIREVSPGIYLGKAFFRTRKGPRFGLGFALDFRKS